MKFESYCINIWKGGIHISKNKVTNDNNKANLYENYSIKMAKSGKTTYKEHKDVSISNGLSFIEANINAIASKLVEHKDKKSHRKIGDIIFGIFKKVSGSYNTIVKNKKKSDIAKKYLERCDSLAKKANFIGAMLIGPAKVLLSVIVVIVSAVFVINASTYDVVLGVYTNGNFAGFLDSRAPMTTAQNAIESDLSMLVGSDYKVKCNIEYSFVNVKKATLLNSADCYRILYDIASKDLTNAYALYIDGKYIAAGDDFDAMNRLLKQAGSPYDSSAAIKNEISVKNQLCLKSSIMTIEQLAGVLQVEVEEMITQRETENAATQRIEVDVPSGTDQSKDSLAIDVGIPRFSDGVDILSLPSTLSDGTRITTDKEELMHELDLVYTKKETLIESIPYETTYIESDDYYVGTQMLKTGGREGSAEFVYEIEYDKNGEISRTVVSSERVKEPVTEVIVIGTSKAPTVNPSGNLIWPIDTSRGISSDYGSRTLFGNYDFHLGVDILDSYGKDIWAADSGTVTHAGYNNSYGYYVTIEHADGMSTLYAHMSKIYTKNGAEVKKGDVIGAVGKTGVATAYHLHFEVRIDGKTVDPKEYLPAME